MVIRIQMGMSQFPPKLCVYIKIDIYIYTHMYINISVLVTTLNILIILVMGGYQIDQYR